MTHFKSTMPGLVNYASTPLSVEMREVDLPTITDDQVLIEVKGVGVCGSDLHQYHGKQSWKVNYPIILGHEFAGVVAQVGKAVRGFAEGDRVVSETAAVIDANSPFSRTGHYNLDPNRLGFGYGVNGAMTKLVAVPSRCLHRLPDTLSFEKAALTEPCCVAYNATCINMHIRPGDSVVIIGPGPIGLLCAIMAKLAGAHPITVVGTPADAARLEVAHTIGATYTLSGSPQENAEIIKAHGDGFGVDCVVDAAGVSATLQLALEVVRPGGQITKVGWGPQPLDFSLDQLVQKAVTLQGSFSHNWPVWEKVIGLLAAEKIDLDPILGRISPLKDWQVSFEEMHRGKIVKAVLVP